MFRFKFTLYFIVYFIGAMSCFSPECYALLSTPTKSKGIKVIESGISVPINILPATYLIHSPESCVIKLTDGIPLYKDTVANKTYYIFRNAEGAIKIDKNFKSQQDVAALIQVLRTYGYFKVMRLSYYDANHKLSRYLEVDYEAKKLKEVKLLSIEDRTMEVSLYSQSGVLNSKVIQRFEKDSTVTWKEWQDERALEKNKSIALFFFWPNESKKSGIKMASLTIP
jgi:hypothetical protein